MASDSVPNRFTPTLPDCPIAHTRLPILPMRVALVSLAVSLLAGCPSDPIDCRDFGRVEGDRDNCVCPEPLIPTTEDDPDYPGCECPMGMLPSGDTCVLPDGGPSDTGPGDSGPIPEEDGCVPVTLYRDADGDGRGDPDTSTTACPGLAGHVENADDCDDTCDSCWTGATETCDESDNDCDGYTDEGVLSLLGDSTNLTPGPQELDTEIRQRIAVEPLRDGGALVFFADAPTASSSVVRVLRVDATGTPVGSATAVDATLMPDQRSISTAQLEDRIILAFSITTPGNIHARAFSNTDGSALTPTRQLNIDSGAANVRVRGGGPGAIFVWEDENTLVYQTRIPALSGPTNSATQFHTLVDGGFVTQSTWVGSPDASTFVFFDDGLHAATFSLEGVTVRGLALPEGFPAERVFLGPGHDAETFALMGTTEDESRFAIARLDGDRVVVESTIEGAPGFFIDGSVPTRSLATTIRFAADAPAGSYLFQHHEGAWGRSVVDLGGGNFAPRIASDLIVYSSKAPDDTEDLLIRRLGCAP